MALGQNLNADIEKGVFDRFRSLPIGRSVPLVGAVIADIGRYLILCVVTLGFGMIMGFRIETNALAATAGIGISIAFALCFCWISVFVGMKVRTSGAVQGIMFLIVLPLSFASNTFVNPETMPSWLQTFVKINPISQLVTTMRGLMIGGPVAGKPDVDAGLDGDPADRLRAAGAARLPQARLTVPTTPMARTVIIDGPGHLSVHVRCSDRAGPQADVPAGGLGSAACPTLARPKITPATPSTAQTEQHGQRPGDRRLREVRRRSGAGCRRRRSGSH